jgi:hypothetical protein
MTATTWQAPRDRSSSIVTGTNNPRCIALNKSGSNVGYPTFELRFAGFILKIIEPPLTGGDEAAQNSHQGGYDGRHEHNAGQANTCYCLPGSAPFSASKDAAALAS